MFGEKGTEKKKMKNSLNKGRNTSDQYVANDISIYLFAAIDTEITIFHAADDNMLH